MAAGQTMPDWLAHRARALGHRLAVVCGEQRWTYRELDRRATRVARRLAHLGVRAGDRVALLLPNGAAFVELVHGISRLGAVLVPLNLRLAPPELAWQLADAGVRLLVYAEATAEVAKAALNLWAGPQAGPATLDEWPGPLAPPAAVAAEALEEVPEAEGVALRERIELDEVHSIIYTSGTTGRPKGALLTYGNYWWSAVGSALNLGVQAEDRWLACLPLFHVGGLSILLRSVIYGTAAVVHPRFDAEEANRAIDEEGITLASVVSTMLARMLRVRGERPYPPTLRAVLVGGGPVPKPLLEQAARLGMPVVQTYGLTEAASQVTTLAPEDALRRLGSAGQPLLPTEVRIERDGRPAAPGEPGEILVRGPTVTPGYLNRPDATERALRDGWLHTGDVGYLDEEGFLYVLDRREDLIVSGGENVYPAEVEAVLLAHPAVEEAGVVGAPDPEWGQVPVAAVKLRTEYRRQVGGKRQEGGHLLGAGGPAAARPRADGSDGAAPGNAGPGSPLGLSCRQLEEELKAFCRQRLAGYKVPRRIHFVEALPRNAAGKLMRHQLRALLVEPP